MSGETLLGWYGMDWIGWGDLMEKMNGKYVVLYGELQGMLGID